MSSSESETSQSLNSSAQDHRSSIIKVFGYQNINVLMKNDYFVHGSTILKVGMKLHEVQAHPERLVKTPSPRVALNRSRKALDQLAISPSFDVDSFSLKSPPPLAHAHTVNSEILSASLDVSSVNILQNNPRNPIIAKRNPNIERMIQDNSKFTFMSPKHSPAADKKLKPTFSSFGLYRSASISSSGGSFLLKESQTMGLSSNNTSVDEMRLSSNSTALTASSSVAAGATSSSSSGTASGATSTDTNDYSVGLCTTMEEVLTMLNDTTPRSKMTETGAATAGDGSPGDGSGSVNTSNCNSPRKTIGAEPTNDELRQHQMQLFHSMREFVGQEYHQRA